MNQDPQVKIWLDWLLISSQPLRHMDRDEKVYGIGSAAMVKYRERTFLLTVQHNVALGSNDWVMDLGYVIGKGISTYRPNAFIYVAEADRKTGDARMIDFCFCEIPPDLNSVYQYRTPIFSGEALPRHVFESDLLAIPSIEKVYAFSGEINLEQHGLDSFATAMSVCPGLKYLRTENEMHIFKLPVKHPGHESFKGCSGAPIVDMEKQIVALVCNGDEAQGTISGVSLARYKFALDFYCDAKLKGMR